MVKFIHRVIFTWIWVCTWVDIVITSLFILGGLAFGFYLAVVPTNFVSSVPLGGLGLFISLVGYVILCLALGFLNWVFTTVHLLMLAYYTRPQAWPEQSADFQAVAVPQSESNNQIFHKSIYSH